MIKAIKALSFALFLALGFGYLVEKQADAQGVNGPQIGCTTPIVYDASTSGNTLLVTGGANTRIYICGYTMMAATATSVGLIMGTGATCATNPIALTPQYQLAANGGIVDHVPFVTAPSVPVGVNLCLKTSAANAVQALVYVSQF